MSWLLEVGGTFAIATTRICNFRALLRIAIWLIKLTEHVSQLLRHASMIHECIYALHILIDAKSIFLFFFVCFGKIPTIFVFVSLDHQQCIFTFIGISNYVMWKNNIKLFINSFIYFVSNNTTHAKWSTTNFIIKITNAFFLKKQQKTILNSETCLRKFNPVNTSGTIKDIKIPQKMVFWCTFYILYYILCRHNAEWGMMYFILL